MCVCVCVCVRERERERERERGRTPNLSFKVQIQVNNYTSSVCLIVSTKVKGNRRDNTSPPYKPAWHILGLQKMLL